MSYFHLGDKENALADINRSLEIEPHYSYRYSSRAFIKEAFGDTAGAIEDYKMCIALDPDDAIAYNNLGLLEERQGYTQLAKKHFGIADKLAGVKPKERVNTKDNTSQNAEKNTPTKSQLIRDIFTKRKTFKEFITFIRRGFKL